MNSLKKIPSHPITFQISIWLLALVFFAMTPAVALFSFSALILTTKSVTTRNLRILSLCGSTYLAFINLTKLPASDLAVYITAFKDAEHLDLGSFLLAYAREPAYYISIYMLAKITAFDSRIYVFLSTLIPYIILCNSIHRLGQALKLKPRVQLSFIIITLLFPQAFSLSAHIMRQFLASSLLIAFMVEIVITRRKYWSLGLSAAMFHYSALFPLLLNFVTTPKNFWRALIFYIAAGYALLVFISPILINIPIIGIVFQRLTELQGHELDDLPIAANIMASILLITSTFGIYKSKKDIVLQHGFPLLFVTFMVSIIVLASSLQPALNEFAVRYFYYLYFLSLPVLAISIARMRKAVPGLYLLAFLSIPLFFYNLAFGVWTYASVPSLLTSSVWDLWTISNKDY